MKGIKMMQRKTWLRMSYWTAALADFVIAVLALITKEAAADRFVYAQGQLAAVAFSWGVLLLIADRKPFERRWILIPTMLVAALLGLVALLSLLNDLIPMSRGLPGIIASVAVFTLLAYSYRVSNENDMAESDAAPESALRVFIDLLRNPGAHPPR